MLTSDCSSTAEIAGDAAWLVDPEAPAAIAEAILGLHENASERGRFRRLGTARAQRFSLQRMANGTLDVYQRLIGR